MGREKTATMHRCLSLIVSCLLLLVACLPTPRPTHIPTPMPTPTPSPTPTSISTPTPIPRSGDVPYGASPAPTATATPTPAPTLDPATVGVTVAKVKARLAEANIEPLCLRWEDTDGDGNAEWVGLHFRPGEPGRLDAFILDGETWHDLRPLEKEKHGLGEYPTCELEVRDVNADGQIEILVWGHAEASIDLLHIFVWDGTTYVLLAFFEGEAGVRLGNTDGDLADEVIVGYEAGNNLAWEAVHTWDGANYGWTWERYTWFYLDRPHVYHTDTPEHAVISFYLAINDHDLPGAYSLFSPNAQITPAEEWMSGFATTVAAEVGAVHEINRSGDTATVVAQVRAYDNVDSRVVATLWDIKWIVVHTDAGWRLDSATADQLDRWETTYYP